MAKIILNSTDDNYIISNNSDSVVAASGVTTQTVALASGVTGVTLDSNIDDVDFSGAIASYQFQETGAGDLNVCDSSGNIITTIAGAAGNTLSFSDGTVAVAKTAFDAAMTVGATAITTSKAAVTPATIDANDASVNAAAATPSTGTGASFSLATTSDVMGPNSGVVANKTTTGDDTIYGLTFSSLTSADILDGGTGSDSIIADYDIGNNAILAVAPVLTSVESVTIKNTGTTALVGAGTDGVAFSAANVTGLTSFTFDSITATNGGDAGLYSATNLGSGVALSLLNNATDNHQYTFSYAAQTGTTDSATLTLQGNTNTTGAVIVTDATATATADTGIETMNLVTTGTGTTAASTLASLAVTDSGATSFNTLNVSGTSNLTITTALDFEGTTTGGTIVNTMGAGTTLTVSSTNDATTFTGGAGNTTLVLGANNDTVIGGAGAETVTISTGSDSITGNAGNDTVIVADTALTASDSINLGEGTRDALVYSNLTTLNSTGISAAELAILAGVSGVEVVGSSAANVTAIDAGYFTQTIYALSGVNAVDMAVTNVAGDTLVLTTGIAGGTNDALTVSGTLPGQSMTIEMNGAASIVVNGTDGAGGDNALNVSSGISTLNINSTTSAASTAGLINGFTADGDVTLDGTAASNGTHTIANTSASAFVLTGDTDFTIESGVTAGFTAAVDFDASQFTGVLTITGSVSADIIKGGSGADVISTMGGADVITLGTGAADTVTYVSGVTGGTASEVVTINGFEVGVGNDNLNIDFDDIENMLDGIGGVTTSDLVIGTSASISAGAASLQTITAAATLDGSSISVLSGANFASTGAVETALEVGGSHAITTGGTLANDDGIVVMYTDGTDSYLAVANNSSGAGIASTTFASGNLELFNIVQFVGVSDVTSFTTANIDFQ